MSEDSPLYQGLKMVKHGSPELQEWLRTGKPTLTPWQVLEKDMEAAALKLKVAEQAKLLKTIQKLHLWGEPPEGYANALKWASGQVDKLLADDK